MQGYPLPPPRRTGTEQVTARGTNVSSNALMVDAVCAKPASAENKKTRISKQEPGNGNLSLDIYASTRTDRFVRRFLASNCAHVKRFVPQCVFGIRNTISKRFLALVAYLFGVGLPSRKDGVDQRLRVVISEVFFTFFRLRPGLGPRV
jgi:hypothetical protein